MWAMAKLTGEELGSKGIVLTARVRSRNSDEKSASVASWRITA